MDAKQKQFNSYAIKSFSPGASNFESSADKITYHYTSPDAFLSIIRNSSIRFTDVRYMNDKSETKFFVKEVLEFLEKNPQKYPNFEEAVYELLKGNNLEAIKNLSLDEIVYTQIPQYPYKPNRHFLFCTCEDFDSLNMWNYYVQNGNYKGYNIGFRADKFLRAFDTSDSHSIDAFLVYYGNVLYSQKQQQDEIERFAYEIEKYVQGLKKNQIKYAMLKIRSYIDAQGLFFKSPKFSSEKEYRIVICISNERIPRKDGEAEKYSGEFNKKMCEGYCVKNGLIAPFLQISFPKDAISRITVSPMTEFSIAKDGIKELLSTNDYGTVVVNQSTIPIRF